MTAPELEPRSAVADVYPGVLKDYLRRHDGVITLAQARSAGEWVDSEGLSPDDASALFRMQIPTDRYTSHGVR